MNEASESAAGSIQEDSWTWAVVESAVEGIVTIDEGGIIRYCNPAALDLFGYTEGELVGGNVNRLMPPEFAGKHDDYLGAYLKTGEKKIIGIGREIEGLRKDGSRFPMHLAVSEVQIENARLFAGIIHDISDRVSAEEEKSRLLRQLKRRNLELDCLYQVGELVRERELDGTLFEAVARTLFGAMEDSSVIGMRITFDDRAYVSVGFQVTSVFIAAEITPEGRRRGTIEAFFPQEGSPDDFKSEGLLLDAVAKVLGTTADRREAEAKIIHASALASIGELAAGVGHEINNPVNGIMNCADIVLRSTDKNSKNREFLDMIRTEADRIATIVKNLLTFSRQEKERHSPARLCDIVDVVLSLSRKKLSNSLIDLRVNVPEDLPKLHCRSEQLQQVLMNLILNASYALDRRYPKGDPDKILAISAEERHETGRPMLRLTVEDHGCGIELADRERVFDPFFTTKGRDEGTGLGLSVSSGIVRDHHGTISLESEVDRVTRFHVDLPLNRSDEIAGG